MRILVVGSGRSAEAITKQPLPFDKIYAINNAWALLPGNKVRWCYSADFFQLGSVLPSLEKQSQFIESTSRFVMRPLWYNLSQMPGGTMLFNTIYHVINTNQKPLQIFLIGCDLDYSDSSHTHFYGLGKFSNNTLTQLRANAPEFAGVAADPFRFGVSALKEELNVLLHLPGIQMFSLSPNPNQLLPYPIVTFEELQCPENQF